MKRYLATSAALALASGAAMAGGLDRTGQPVGIIFEKGNYAELSFSHTNPDVTGTDVRTLNPAGTPSGNVALSFNQISGGIKYDLNDRVSFSMIFDQPWGSDIRYPSADANPITPGSFLLGGTTAIADSEAITGIVRYKFNENFSVHGGIRYQQIKGDITLKGLAYNSPLTPGNDLDGYNVRVARDGAVGWLVGGAYERPDIALRLAVTYQSEIEHTFATTESLPDVPGTTFNGSTTTKTPQSLNVDFQTGIAKDTLLLAGIRWAEHSVVKLRPSTANVDLIDLSDSVSYTLGVARRFNENLVGSISLGYEAEDSDNLVSPLAPTNGYKSISVGLQYTKDQFKISGGVRYTDLGDAFAETGTPDVARASFSGNKAVSVGVKFGYYF
ncbi:MULTISPECIES: OmpP1/FadL family transporter [unclassified Phaeobacter]|uniref:OmpP1/FadL family transporter n=1 Tax=unclassified Phaeobacter TaxID=2621772 RepID=UPI003A8C1BFB